MTSLRKVFTSSIGKKYVMALSGLALVIFVITHLLGNLTLLFPNSEVFNNYAHRLESFGPLLWAAEIGLLVMALLHVTFATSVTLNNKQGRGAQGYAKIKSKGGPTKNTFSSRNMYITGSLLLIFLVVHILQFKFGPGVKEGYVTQAMGVEVRDLYRLVDEVFHQPLYVAFYVFIMLALGLHLRHGFWSAFQSLGLMYPKLSKGIYTIAFFLALVLAVGFLALPLIIYFRH